MIVTKRDHMRNAANRVRVRCETLGIHGTERGMNAGGFFCTRSYRYGYGDGGTVVSQPGASGIAHAY